MDIAFLKDGASDVKNLLENHNENPAWYPPTTATWRIIGITVLSPE
jgi:hypothetical protein